MARGRFGHVAAAGAAGVAAGVALTLVPVTTAVLLIGLVAAVSTALLQQALP